MLRLLTISTFILLWGTSYSQNALKSYDVAYEKNRLGGDPVNQFGYHTHHHMGGFSIGYIDAKQLAYGLNLQLGYRWGWGQQERDLYSSELFSVKITTWARKYIEMYPQLLFGLQTELSVSGADGSTWLSTYTYRGGERFNENIYFFGFTPSLAYKPHKKWILDISFGSAGFGSRSLETSGGTTITERYRGSLLEYGYFCIKYIRLIGDKKTIK